MAADKTKNMLSSNAVFLSAAIRAPFCNSTRARFNLVLDRYFTESFDADVYLAGPPIMVKFTRQVLAGKGIQGNRIHRDPIRVR